MSTPMSSQEENVLLLEKSRELAVALMPVIMYVSFLMILGIFGNSIVLYYYRWKTKPTPTNCFIVALAAFDLLNCVLGMPMDHADLILYIAFDNASSCKILRFVTFYTSIASGLTVLSIAIDRYRRICWPHIKQSSVRQARIISTVCAFISALISWPTFVLYAAEHVRVIYTDPMNATHQLNITGYDCKLTASPEHTPYVLAFHVFQFIIFTTVTVTLAVLYGLIGRQLFELRRYSKRLKRNDTRPQINVQSASVTLCSSSSRLNVYSTDEINTQMETDNQSSQKHADAVDTSVVSLDLIREFRHDAECRSPPHDEDRLKTSVLNECVYNLSQYRKDTTESRANSVATSNFSQNKIMALRNRRMSWPYQTGKGYLEYSSSTFVKGSDTTHSDNLINSTWTLPVGRQTLLSRSLSDCDCRQISGDKHGDSEEIGCHERQTKASEIESLPSSRFIKRREEKRIKIDDRSNKAECLQVRSRFGKLDRRTVKSTMIMFVVALVFVVSFLPYLCVAIWSLFQDGYEVNILTNEQLVAFNFGYLSYLINSSFNPLIYGLFNSKFRQFVYSEICCRCCQKAILILK